MILDVPKVIYCIESAVDDASHTTNDESFVQVELFNFPQSPRCYGRYQSSPQEGATRSNSTKTNRKRYPTSRHDRGPPRLPFHLNGPSNHNKFWNESARKHKCGRWKWRDRDPQMTKWQSPHPFINARNPLRSRRHKNSRKWTTPRVYRRIDFMPPGSTYSHSYYGPARLGGSTGTPQKQKHHHPRHFYGRRKHACEDEKRWSFAF